MMLVLSRRCGEQIVIDDRVTIRVLEVKGNRVRLGIDAPLEMPILRAELWEPIEMDIEQAEEPQAA